MSKNRKKRSVKLNPGDSVVVLNYQTLMYLSETCDMLASEHEDQESAEAWRAIADEIRIQTVESHYELSEEEEWI